MMKPILEEIDKELPGVIQKVDIEAEENLSLVEKYGVMSVPTFISVQDDKEVARVVGMQTKQKLLDIIK